MTEPYGNFMTISREENPRQRLLEIIDEKGPITIKDLRQMTGMSVGSLYHHLSKLDEYVTQDEHKRYLLSTHGRELFASHKILELQKQPWYTSFILPALRNKYSVIVTIIAVLQLYVFAYTSASQLLMLPVRHGGIIESIGLGWVLSILLAEGLSIAAGAKPGRDLLALAGGMSIASVPIALFSTVADSYLSIPLYVIALFVASATISNAKNLSYPSSVGVALSVMLLSIAVFTSFLGVVIVIPVAISIAIIVLARSGYFEIIYRTSRAR
jgi:hypothetical protein